MRLFNCLAAALGLGSISTDNVHPVTIERLEVIHYVTRHVVVTVTTVPRPFKSPSAVTARARPTTYALASQPFEMPLADTRSPLSATSLLYDIGEWGSQSITITYFQILAGFFLLLLVGFWPYCRSAFIRFHATARNSIRALYQLPAWLLLQGYNTTNWFTFVAIPRTNRTVLSLLVLTFRFTWPRIRSHLHTLAIYLVRKIRLRDRSAALHLHYLCLTRSSPDDPTYALAARALSLTLPERIHILQQNDALLHHTALQQAKHKRIVAEMQRDHERRVLDVKRAYAYGWDPSVMYPSGTVSEFRWRQDQMSLVTRENKWLEYQDGLKKQPWAGSVRDSKFFS